MEPVPDVDAAVSAIEDEIRRHLRAPKLARWVRLTKRLVERPLANWALLTERLYELVVSRRQQLAFRPPGRLR